MPEVQHQATFIPHQPAMLVIGDKRIPIDEWPLARSVQEDRSVEVEEASRDRFVIAPRKRANIKGTVYFMFLVSAAALPGFIIAAIGFPWWLSTPISLVFLLGIVALICAALTSQQRIRFYRQVGKLTIEHRVFFSRRFAEKCAYPLESIRAVQLLYTGRHSISVPQGSPEQQTITTREYFGYELNLIMDDPKSPRLNLLSLADWQWLRETGHALGDFLGVPVIDRLQHGA